MPEPVLSGATCMLLSCASKSFESNEETRTVPAISPLFSARDTRVSEDYVASNSFHFD